MTLLQPTATLKPAENNITMAETHHFDVNRLFGVKGYVAVVTGGGTGIGLM